MKMLLKILPAKWGPFCPGELSQWHREAGLSGCWQYIPPHKFFGALNESKARYTNDVIYITTKYDNDLNPPGTPNLVWHG